MSDRMLWENSSAYFPGFLNKLITLEIPIVLILKYKWFFEATGITNSSCKQVSYLMSW